MILNKEQIESLMNCENLLELLYERNKIIPKYNKIFSMGRSYFKEADGDYLYVLYVDNSYYVGKSKNVLKRLFNYIDDYLLHYLGNTDKNIIKFTNPGYNICDIKIYIKEVDNCDIQEKEMIRYLNITGLSIMNKQLYSNSVPHNHLSEFFEDRTIPNHINMERDKRNCARCEKIIELKKCYCDECKSEYMKNYKN